MSFDKMDYCNKQASMYKINKKLHKYVHMLTSIDEETEVDLVSFYIKFQNKKLETIYETDENYMKISYV
jgi:hypothetical protein